MSLERRGKTGFWHIRVTNPNGVRVQRSTRTLDKVRAKQLHDKFVAQLWDQVYSGKRPRYKWEAAAGRWLRETEHKASQADDIRALKWLNPYLAGKYLDEIDRDLMERVLTAKLDTGVSNATVNRTLQPVRAILRKAHREWNWLGEVPALRFLPEPKRRVRFLTKDEAARLIAELPSHLSAMARFSLATGCREANTTGLQWSQVDLDRRMAWIHPDQAKARKAIPIPLNAGAMAVLREQWGKHLTHVFTFAGRPIKKAGGRAWKKALMRACIENFRWHDWRHCWASWHVMAGTPLHTLQELGGWESAEMVRKYAHLDSQHLAEHAEKIALPVVGGANLVRLEGRVA